MEIEGICGILVDFTVHCNQGVDTQKYAGIIWDYWDYLGLLGLFGIIGIIWDYSGLFGII
jgi:hypothetical protein